MLLDIGGALAALGIVLVGVVVVALVSIVLLRVIALALPGEGPASPGAGAEDAEEARSGEQSDGELEASEEAPQAR